MPYEYDYDANYRLVEGSGREVMVVRKVKTRHFGYSDDHVFINIVVGDVPDGEMLIRLKR
jgi:hypothetical protein